MKRTASIYQSKLPDNPNKSVDHATTLVQVDSIWLNQFYDVALLSSRSTFIP